MSTSAAKGRGAPETSRRAVKAARLSSGRLPEPVGVRRNTAEEAEFLAVLGGGRLLFGREAQSVSVAPKRTDLHFRSDPLQFWRRKCSQKHENSGFRGEGNPG